MLAESITKERKEILVREKAQQKVCLSLKKKEKMNTKIYTWEAHKISIISFISTLHVIDGWMFSNTVYIDNFS